jgi:hypothetical protein
MASRVLLSAAVGDTLWKWRMNGEVPDWSGDGLCHIAVFPSINMLSNKFKPHNLLLREGCIISIHRQSSCTML